MSGAVVSGNATKADATKEEVASGAAAISVEGLTHFYRGKKTESVGRAALLDVSLSIQRGEVFGLLGPNGSGKTTLFKVLATMMRPNSGGEKQPRISLFGVDVLANPAGVREHLGVVFQSPSLDGELTVYENLRAAGRLQGMSTPALTEAIAANLVRFNLSDRKHDGVKTLSGGLKRRVELAKAMLHRPRLLMLDEPEAGLDVHARRELWDQLQTLRDELGTTVLMTTHLMEAADRCDRLAVLHEGKVIAEGEPLALKQAVGTRVVTITPMLGVEISEVVAAMGDAALAAATLETLGQSYRFFLDPSNDLLAKLGEAIGVSIQSYQVSDPTLEDAFIRLTGAVLD